MFKAVNKSEKVSDNIISQIRDSILSGLLKPGDRLASEKELMTQFQVSKATMREALRVLEVMGLVEIRKGTAGGAFVAEVDMKTTINSIINFIHFKPISVRDITMLRYLIEPGVARMAALKRSERDISNLRGIIGKGVVEGEAEVIREIGFHRYLARMTGNTILILLIDFVDNLLSTIKTTLDLDPGFYHNVRASHEAILECLIRKDSAGAGRAMTDDLLQVGRDMAAKMGTEPFDPSEI
ncbi:MAG: FadR family transcriptional regulator [Deltaproteobacteria bacterium]|nr:FadR family transcriptional regulator [Deltaproteobacteria bacterium]MBW2050011.1 FadR family transcriptional regulator [Deltaproteobacteria bacterium]MBW2112812.1 FadR family transcriptional regulator [Deltaproteobacteria bacterium]MBW2352879.1 FadR family transcriptional regulator [Deltaproteobacteria bacterium]HDZ90718.1 FadR family transcriptional regulator [Deltaproteobacteria bacterium]